MGKLRLAWSLSRTLDACLLLHGSEIICGGINGVWNAVFHSYILIIEVSYPIISLQTSDQLYTMWPTPKVASLLLAAHALLVSGSPVDAEAVDAAVLAKRQCPQIHVFGARETTAPAGYGTAGVVVNLVLGAYPGATAEAINYPACGGQSQCGGVQYGDSARQGTNAVASAVNSFNQRCPNSQIVLVGYSQGELDSFTMEKPKMCV